MTDQPTRPAMTMREIRDALGHTRPAGPADQPEPETDEQRADREETEREHAAGIHTHCDLTCEVDVPTEHLRNFVIAKGYPGTKGALDELLRRAAAPAAAATAPPAAETLIEEFEERHPEAMAAARAEVRSGGTGGRVPHRRGSQDAPPAADLRDRIADAQATPTATPAVWSDTDLLMNAIAADVYEQCATHPEQSLTVDDPRTIAAVAATTARLVLGTTEEEAARLRAEVERLRANRAAFEALAAEWEKRGRYGDSGITDRARELRAVLADEAQQPETEAHVTETEAWPTETAWIGEVLEDDGAWMFLGASPDRAVAEKRRTSITRRHPDAQTRTVRKVTTYTVAVDEQPAPAPTEEPTR